MQIAANSERDSVFINSISSVRNIQQATNLDFEVQEFEPTIDKAQAANQSKLFHQEQMINDLSYDVWAKERVKKDEKQEV